jgi:hypothetical protein
MAMGLQKTVAGAVRWDWPTSLDALVAAAEYHTLLMENEFVRVVQTRIPPGETVPVHTHRWPFVAFIESWSDIVRRDPQGKVTLDTRESAPPKLNAPVWDGPLLPHSVENVGAVELKIVQVEMKGLPGF